MIPPSPVAPSVLHLQILDSFFSKHIIYLKKKMRLTLGPPQIERLGRAGRELTFGKYLDARHATLENFTLSA